MNKYNLITIFLIFLSFLFWVGWDYHNNLTEEEWERIESGSSYEETIYAP